MDTLKFILFSLLLREIKMSLNKIVNREKKSSCRSVFHPFTTLNLGGIHTHTHTLCDC